MSAPTPPIGFTFDNTYARELEGFYQPQKPAGFSEPALLRLNTELAEELGLNVDALTDELAAQIFAGNVVPNGALPLAQAYAGHQFGGFSPQLGDGRALLLGELIDKRGRRRDLQLKGSGPTPFSRGGDGKAAIGPVLREYLVGESMYALGVPTTRALGAVATGEPVFRESALPGAVLARVAASHIRIGTFEFFASREQTERVERLADYALARHYPELVGAANPYAALLEAVVGVQAKLVAHWMSLGFVHGVLNTDNVTISGETIDYGPCAFMEAYDPGTVFSSIDRRGRYAYGNQPSITLWNLSRFAETLLPLLGSDEKARVASAERILKTFAPLHEEARLAGMAQKLGIATPTEEDAALIQRLLDVMKHGEVDYTSAFRALGEALRGSADRALEMFGVSSAFADWMVDWRARLAKDSRDSNAIADAMDAVNPIYIPRNHKIEEALAAASEGNLGPFERLLSLVSKPFTQVEDSEAFASPAPPDFGPYTTFCGT